MKPPIHHDWLDIICGFLLVIYALLLVIVALSACGGADYPKQCQRSSGQLQVESEPATSPCAGADDMALRGDVPDGCKEITHREDGCESYTEAQCPNGLLVSTSWQSLPSGDVGQVVVWDIDRTCMSSYKLTVASSTCSPAKMKEFCSLLASSCSKTVADYATCTCACSLETQ